MAIDIDTWFNSLDRLQSVAIGAVAFYLLIVLMSRLAGKRTTGQMNNFDWIITVTVGSLAASGILLKGVSISDALLAILIMFGLQWLTTWLATRSAFVSNLVKSPPSMLLQKGELQRDALRKERVTEAEVRTALRREGFVNFEDANWVVLENDGTMTVIPRKSIKLDDSELMNDVRRS